MPNPLPHNEVANPSMGSAATLPKEQLEIIKLRVDTEKASAERDKAVLESIRLKAPWYLRPEILQPIAAIAIAGITALVGFSNGWFQTKLDSLKNQQERAQLDLQKLNDTRADLRSQIAELLKQREDLAAKLTATLAKAQELEAMYKEAATRAGQGEHYRADAENLRKELASQIEFTRNAVNQSKDSAGVTLSVYLVDAKTGKTISKNCEFKLITSHGNYNANTSFDGDRWIVKFSRSVEAGSPVEILAKGYASDIFDAWERTEWHITLDPQ